MRNLLMLIAFVLLLSKCVSSSSTSGPVAGKEERGAQLFAQGHGDAPPCSTCHHTFTGQYGFSLGPNLSGIRERAGMRVEELTAEEYLRQSVLEPGRYLVPGYRNMMYPDYERYFTEQDIQDLIVYLLTL